MKTFIDPGLLVHRTIAQVMTHFVLALADNHLLPMNASKYAEKLSLGVKTLAEKHGDVLDKYNVTIGKHSCEIIF